MAKLTYNKSLKALVKNSFFEFEKTIFETCIIPEINAVFSEKTVIEKYGIEHYNLIYDCICAKIRTFNEKRQKLAYLHTLKLKYKDLPLKPVTHTIINFILGIITGFGIKSKKIMVFAVVFGVFYILCCLHPLANRQNKFYLDIIDTVEKKLL